jgi:hypothetical protein
MKKNIYIILIFFILGNNLKAQQTKVKAEITTMPFSLLEPGQRHLRFGLKYYAFKKISLGIDLGYGAPFFTKKILNYQYYSVRPEIDLTIYSSNNYHIYTGIEYVYYSDHYTIQNSSFLIKNGTISFASANYYKYKEAAHLKIGISFYTDKKFVIDLYTGVGIRRKYSYYDNIKDGNYIYNYVNNDFFISSRTGLISGLNLSLGMRIGFYFSKKQKVIDKKEIHKKNYYPYSNEL